MKKIKTVLFFVSLSSIVFVGTIQFVQGFSQTIELNQGVYSGIADFDLQVGDHVEGSFSVGNLGPYQRLFGSGTSCEVVDVWIIPPNEAPPNGNAILNFTATPSNNTFNFNFTAQEQGIFQMWTFSGAMDYVQNAKNPVVTLSYDVINATTQTSPPEDRNAPHLEPIDYLLPISIILVVSIVLSVLLYRMHRKST